MSLGPPPPVAPPASPSVPPEVKRLADPPPFAWPPARALAGTLVLLLLLSGLAYPAAVVGFARVTGGFAPSGAFVPGGDPGTLAAYALGQNITNDSLFWLRPSMIDYNATLGSGENPYGPTDPALVNLTAYYIGIYGLNNTTVPLELVGNSASGLDPDLTPEAVLVQVPRVSAATHLTEPFLIGFVNERIVAPIGGILGPSYVNVLLLDTDLLTLLAHRGAL